MHAARASCGWLAHLLAIRVDGLHASFLLRRSSGCAVPCILALPRRIIRGLIASELSAAAEALVRNLLSLVDAHGFVPNGARSYYTNRSQPPLLASMVLEVWRAQQAQEQTQQARAQQAAGAGAGAEGGALGDGLQLLREALPRLEKQHAYWTRGPRCAGLECGVCC